MTVVVSRRDRILRPYAQEKMQRDAVLMSRQAFAPNSLDRLLFWARSEWALEVPDKLHHFEVGSSDALGAPKWRWAFLDYLSGHALTTDASDPDAVDAEQAYVYPMHAALYRIHGRDETSNEARVARFLFSLPCLGWDWRMACAKDGIPTHAAHAYTEGALLYWWRMYERVPPARTIRAA